MTQSWCFECDEWFDYEHFRAHDEPSVTSTEFQIEQKKKPLLVVPKAYMTSVPIVYPNRNPKPKTKPKMIPVVETKPLRRRIDFAESGCYVARVGTGASMQGGDPMACSGKGSMPKGMGGKSGKGKGKGK